MQIAKLVRYIECRGHNSLRPCREQQAESGRNELWPLHPNYFVKSHYHALETV